MNHVPHSLRRGAVALSLLVCLLAASGFSVAHAHASAGPYCIKSGGVTSHTAATTSQIQTQSNVSLNVIDGVSWITGFSLVTNLCGLPTGISGTCIMRTANPVDTGNIRCVLQKKVNGTYQTEYDTEFVDFNDTSNFPVHTPSQGTAPGDHWRLGIAGWIDWADGNEVITPNYPNIDITYWDPYTVPA